MPPTYHGGGINPTFRFGNHFIKSAAKQGSPHAEVAASKVFGLLGVPHNPTRLVHLKKTIEARQPGVGFHEVHPGQPLVASKFLPMRSLKDFGKEGDKSHVAPLENRQQHLNTLLAEWLASVEDRNAGNYALTPQHGIISIDHGEALHPATSWWPEVLGGEPTRDYAKLRTNAHNWSVNPQKSSLHTLAFGGPYPDERTTASHSVKHLAQAHQKELEDLAYEGSHGLPEEEERVLARLAMRNRIHTLVQHPRPINFRELGRLHDRAIENVQREMHIR